LTASEFAARIFDSCALSPAVVSAFVADSGVTWIQIRVSLTGSSFVEVFFNEVTGKTAYAWIKDSQRILGADNTRNWNWHPFTSPDTHVPAGQPISFSEFLREVERRLAE
jgi:hypothetical protein